MIFLLCLVCLSAQEILSNGNISYRYTIGFLYERHAMSKIIDVAAVVTNSDNFQIHFEDVHVESDSAFECLNSSCYFFLRYPTVGIIGPASRINVDTIQSICSARNIPHVLTDYVGQLQGETQLNFYPNIKLLANAYIDILSSMKWEQFTFLYTSRNYTPWVKFIEKVQSHGFDYDIEYINLDIQGEGIDIVKKLRNTDKKYFVIDCLEEDTMRILSLFQNYGIINKHYHYFFTSIDTFNESISTFKSSGVDITKVQLLNSKAQAYHRVKYFSHLPTVSEALIFDAIQVFAHALKNLKLVQNENVNCENGTEWKDGNLILNYMLSNSYIGLTGKISFGTDRYRNTSELFIHKLMPDGMTQVGTWNALNGVEYINSSYEKPIPYDWRSKPLVVATLLKAPYVIKKESSYPLEGNDRYQGFAIDLIEELSKIEHFTYNIVLVEGGAGSREISGKWTGILGEILKENADLGILDITITSDRLHAVEFTHPIMHTGITILFQKPTAMPPRFYFMRPFSTGLWTAIALSFLAATISLFIVGRLCNSEWQKLNPTSNFNTSQLTFPNTIWFVAGSLFRQNTQVKIRSIPGRIIAAAWWWLCFILIAMYIAALVSHRVKYEEDKNMLFSDIKSLIENAEKHGISYGALKHSATLEFFKTASVPLYQELYQHMIENEDDIVVSTDEAVQRAEKTRYAFFTEKAAIDYITQHHCQLMQYDGLINENAHGIALRRNSPYLTSLNTAILKLSNTGKLDELKRKWWNKGTCYVEIGDNEAYPLYIDILGLIQVTLIGIAVAVISAIVEFLLYVDKKRKKLEISFFKIFKLELKKCFSGNAKTIIVDGNLIIKPIPKNEEHEATADGIELS